MLREEGCWFVADLGCAGGSADPPSSGLGTTERDGWLLGGQWSFRFVAETAWVITTVRLEGTPRSRSGEMAWSCSRCWSFGEVEANVGCCRLELGTPKFVGAAMELSRLKGGTTGTVIDSGG
ncbi:hypothetical protein MLD38_022022 [Melastoma candidum]|uniref:Uncharacterized protein n=1 Tax=Melastoma candidum TaxID=119954 RepID=A0ACB9QJR1_9MYRT|nr:hypothetical protein MLD38_022022 [Melastoma candidum]